MKFTRHLIVSTIAGSALYNLTGSKQMALSLFLSGVFIDLDHVFDFLVLSNKKFTLNNFFSWFNDRKWERVFVMLHSYELFLILASIAYFARSDIVLGLLMGSGIHLIMDLIENMRVEKDFQLSRWFYFLSFRYASNFEKRRMLANRT
jgi:hypothetical protein